MLFLPCCFPGKRGQVLKARKELNANSDISTFKFPLKCHDANFKTHLAKLAIYTGRAQAEGSNLALMYVSFYLDQFEREGLHSKSFFDNLGTSTFWHRAIKYNMHFWGTISHKGAIPSTDEVDNRWTSVLQAFQTRVRQQLLPPDDVDKSLFVGASHILQD